VKSLVPYEERVEDEVDPVLGRPFRVQAKLRNNRLIKARELLGYKSPRDAADALGLSYATILDYEGLKLSPWQRAWAKREAGWKYSALKIAKAYRQLPEDLWPEVIADVESTYAEIEVGSGSVGLIPSSENPEERLLLEEKTELVEKTIARLSPREADMLRGRFGFDGEGESYKSVGVKEGVCAESARQIVTKAVRKVRRVLETEKDVFDKEQS
jgi:DNA-directed RNA polymerase specialized sigma24 family protein